MEPLRPETRRAILNANPRAGPQIEEYERLLAERFTTDPDAAAPHPQDARVLPHKTREQRLRELYHQLFDGLEAR
ncbi:MAG TPA: hypothetical protein VMG35_14095 [Bryobacteraceae bacterium]|nr:hypothetical protein [Bryobacteraceae bacterium]